MRLPVREIPFRLLTPCFCGGAGQEAELRVPSIRGQIRFWHGERFGTANVGRVWGAVGKKPTASQIAVTAKAILSPLAKDFNRLLPHADSNSPNKDERDKANSKRDALLPGEFHLTLRWLPARPPCVDAQSPAQDWADAQTAVRLWLLIGALGLRSNRAAGSVWPADAPVDPKAFAVELAHLRCPWTIWFGRPRTPLLGKTVEARCEALRTVASDTPAGQPDIFGEIKPKRKPSPVRFKVITFGDTPTLVMLARDSKLLPEAQKFLLTHLAGRLDWQPLYPLPPAVPS